MQYEQLLKLFLIMWENSLENKQTCSCAYHQPLSGNQSYHGEAEIEEREKRKMITESDEWKSQGTRALVCPAQISERDMLGPGRHNLCQINLCQQKCYYSPSRSHCLLTSAHGINLNERCLDSSVKISWIRSNLLFKLQNSSACFDWNSSVRINWPLSEDCKNISYYHSVVCIQTVRYDYLTVKYMTKGSA